MRGCYNIPIIFRIFAPKKRTQIKFKINGDNRGKLISLEQLKNIPFEIKRVYYMYDTKYNASRGKHAHKKLQQILICIHGKCKILLDDGKEKRIVILSKPNEGLYISNNIWREMYDFEDDCVLMCVASELYDESDYIRDYNEFIDFIGGGTK